jgi:diaminopimelate epimerase
MLLPAPSLPFWKYQGTGNDFVVIDDRAGIWEPFLKQEQIAFLCDRRFGIGADGLILLAASETQDFRMVYFNADGRQSTMCGNGGRCLVAFAHQSGLGQKSYIFEAIDGLHHAEILSDGRVALEMSLPTGFQQLGPEQYWIDTGSPHYVAFVSKLPDTETVFREGHRIRHDERFAPGGTNVNFAQIKKPNSLKVRTFERGVEAETLSCGTGVTACAYVYFLQQNAQSDTIEIESQGGELEVKVEHQGQAAEKVVLIGPATAVFSGSLQHLPMG